MPLAIDTQNLHPSTLACIEALQWLHERAEFTRILDMGCGDGVLSIITASIWDSAIVSADIDAKAVADAQKNIEKRGFSDRIHVVRSEGFSDLSIEKAGPYDLIIANLLADTLLSLAHSIKNNLISDGYLLLAGMLAWRAAEVQQAYIQLGFEILHQIDISPWKCLILRRQPELSQSLS